MSTWRPGQAYLGNIVLVLFWTSTLLLARLITCDVKVLREIFIHIFLGFSFMVSFFN